MDYQTPQAQLMTQPSFGGIAQTLGNITPYIGDPVVTTGGTGVGQVSNCETWINWPSSNTYSYSYPIYVDKAEKALAIAKKLREDKVFRSESIDKFLELVDMIKAEL